MLHLHQMVFEILQINFTYNTSEGINRAFREEFKSAQNNLDNVLLLVKEFKKKYILQKADKMGDDRIRLRPKAQIRRTERRENLIPTFHNLQLNCYILIQSYS